jgi:hypothetical protein
MGLEAGQQDPPFWKDFAAEREEGSFKSILPYSLLPESRLKRALPFCGSAGNRSACFKHLWQIEAHPKPRHFR